MRKTILPQLMLLFLCSLVGRAQEKKLVILQTSDVHGRMGLGHETQGWVNLSTLIKKERQKAPGRSLYIDCGDSIQGTHIESIFKGAASMAALEHLKPDAWIPGNHEFDFGVTRLNEIIAATTFPVLNGNVTLTARTPARLKGYRIIQRSGLKVAVIGLNTGKLKSWFWGKDYDQFTVAPAIDYLERTLPEIQRQSPNLIILAIHQGLLAGRRSHGEVYDICKRFPQIDLILGGHTHQAIPGKRIWGAFVVQPGQHGEYLSRVVATFDKTGKLKQLQSSLLDGCDVEPDPELKRVLEPFTKQAKRDAFEVLSEAPDTQSADGVPGVNNAMSDLFCRAIQTATSADAVLYGAHNTLSWKKGPVYNWQLFASIPYENSICVVDLTEAELKTIIEEQLSFTPREHMQGIYGVRVYVGSDGKTVNRMAMPSGKRTVSLALSNFCVAGGGWRYPALKRTLASRKADIRQLKIHTRDAVSTYMKATPSWQRPPQKWLTFQSK